MRPLEKSILENAINNIDTYINGAPMQLKNPVFVAGAKMYLPIEELLSILGIKYDSNSEYILLDERTHIKISGTSVVETNPDSSETMLGYIVKEVGQTKYIDAMFFIEYLDVTIAWEDDTRCIYICTYLHYDGYRILPASVFNSDSDNHYIHGFFMYVDGEVLSQSLPLITVGNENGEIILQGRSNSPVEDGKKYRFCISFNENRIEGKPTGRIMEIGIPSDNHRYGFMIYSEESYNSFKDFKEENVESSVYDNTDIMGFNQTRLRNAFLQYPDMLEDRKRLSAILNDLFPGNKRNINLFLLAYDAGIVNDISKEELDDILVYKWINILVEDYGIQLEYASDTICLWCQVYGNGILDKTFIAKRKYSPEIQLELQNREVLWRSSRLTHPKTLGDLIYFEPIEWYKKAAQPPYEGTYYYPYEEMLGMIWFTKKANISYGAGNLFNYNGIILGLCKDDFSNLLTSNDVIVAGLPGKKANYKLMIGGDEWECNTYILPTPEEVYLISFSEKHGISPAMLRYEKEFLGQIRTTKTDANSETIIFENAVEFEKQLNQGKCLDGAIVTFEIEKVCPDLNPVFGGYNLWGGEHLNFISKRPMSVNKGELFTVKVLYTTKVLGDSWVIHYEPMDGSDTQGDWADCNTSDIADIVKRCEVYMKNNS